MTFKQFWRSRSFTTKFVLISTLVSYPVLVWYMIDDNKVWAFYGAILAFNLWQGFGLLDDILNGRIVQKEELK